MRRTKRTPDAGYEAGAPSWSPDPDPRPAPRVEPSDDFVEDPECACGGGRDDVGLFLDICLSVCSAPEERPRRRRAPKSEAGGSSGRSCASDDFTADTWSSSSGESAQRSGLACADAVAGAPPPEGPPPRPGADPQQRTRETSPARPGPQQPPKPSREKVRQVGSRALPPPSPLRINIVYRDRSFGSDCSSVISESVTIGAAEGPRLVSKLEGRAGARQPNSSESFGSATSSATPADDAPKEFKGWKLLDAGRSHPLQTPAAKAEGLQGRQKEEDLGSGRCRATARDRPGDATSAGGSAAVKPGGDGRGVRGGRVSGSTLRRLFSGRKKGGQGSIVT
ncbi:hypothetical protein THAOC_15389 [Thalassiosira oceanica]|uniref:Uncharacterized protein n=1 Tax=Thalassiosira oceanica TaxID=159749 RepID=K0T0B6_THAOC|nr:hypothetical protein THAOC_15389 [Thalassiosira oceanica]|eukprot:EJK63927.1 hypothetical protein THAOC_15389 [Thalassiosira oceanica]